MADDSVDLWALDEVHFQQQGSRCRLWVPPETKDPVVYHHPTRKSVGYFGACVYGTANFCSAAKLEDSTEKPSGNSSECFSKPVLFPAAAFWPLATTHNIIAPNFIWGGATYMLPSSAWISCRPTARI